ncbi:kallikrein-1 [Rhynchocyon petersi]
MWLLTLCLALSLGGTGATPIQSRIVGGWECKPHSQPWQVSLHNYNRPECGGALIDPKWVLTAAHCKNDKYQLWLGIDNLEDPDDTTQYAQVSKDFPHPSYNMSHQNPSFLEQDDYSHDIMLLQLSKPVELTNTVKLLELPTEEPVLGSTCIASGWGSLDPNGTIYPDQLQCLKLKLLPNEVCAKAHIHKVTDTMLCAAASEGKDTCVGDSGGPLICDGMFQGITSWGYNPCATPKKPAVFTKIIQYLKWIKETMEANP